MAALIDRLLQWLCSHQQWLSVSLPPCSPCLLDLVEIERKLREAKAERERLLRERVSHLPWETLAGTSNRPQHTALGTAVWSLTPTQLAHDGPRRLTADMWTFAALKYVPPLDFMCLKQEREELVNIHKSLLSATHDHIFGKTANSFLCVSAGRATAAVVGGEKTERAELSQNRTAGARNTTKVWNWPSTWTSTRTKGATKGHFPPKLPGGVYDITTIKQRERLVCSVWTQFWLN